MCGLALIGFTGMFLRHRIRSGLPRAHRYGLLRARSLAMFAQECIVGHYLPTVGTRSP